MGLRYRPSSLALSASASFCASISARSTALSSSRTASAARCCSSHLARVRAS